MPDEDFFQRLVCEFSAHHARAVEMAERDEQAERHIATAESELSQTHRALRTVLQAARAPEEIDVPIERAHVSEAPETGDLARTEANDTIAA